MKRGDQVDDVNRAIAERLKAMNLPPHTEAVALRAIGLCQKRSSDGGVLEELEAVVRDAVREQRGSGNDS